MRRVVLQVEETSAYCTVNHRALASNYQLSNMKRPARDSNRQPQRLEVRTFNRYTTKPPDNLKTENRSAIFTLYPQLLPAYQKPEKLISRGPLQVEVNARQLFYISINTLSSGRPG